jgi:hypothetical protein
MRATWPSFVVAQADDRSATWTGCLKPFMQSYEVAISYRVPLIIENIDPLRQQPRVRILSPYLKRWPSHVEGGLPHVYWDDLICPALCLFDYETGEWSPFKLLADTTVPWAVDWLACYEGWRATGKWTGGGRHTAPIRKEDAA